MSRVRLVLVATMLAALVACAPAASDSDGEVFVGGPITPAAAKSPDPLPVVVDTDLAPDDLAALALLVRHPDVEVVAVTVPQTGIRGCNGLGLLADLFAALDEPAPPVGCGETSRGEEGIAFPWPWSGGALGQSGLATDDDTTGVARVPLSAAELLARMARRHEGLHVVAIGPLTEVARTLRDSPGDYVRLAGITTMAGAVSTPSQTEGVAAAFTAPGAATTESGTWSVDIDTDRGRLRRTGEGTVQVVTALDVEALDEVYASVFG